MPSPNSLTFSGLGSSLGSVSVRVAMRLVLTLTLSALSEQRIENGEADGCRAHPFIRSLFVDYQPVDYEAMKNAELIVRMLEQAGVRYAFGIPSGPRSEEHTSELQSQSNLVCRLLLEKKK